MTTYFPVCVLCGNTIKRVETDTDIEWHANRTPARECPNGAGYHTPELQRPLNEVMEFDHVIRVNADGTVSDSPLSPYFDLLVVETSEGHWEDEFSIPEGWQLMTGFSGQYGYSGPVMHSSEFIGGGMARHILETPGDYVALVVKSEDLHDWQPANTHNGDGSAEWCRACGDVQDADNKGYLCHGGEPAGWTVAFKPLEEA